MPTPPPHPWSLAELHYAHVKAHAYEVAVLPFGATEPHNLHLPYGTDNFEADLLADKACEAAHRAGAKVLRLPTIPYGTETNMTRCKLAINLNPSTLQAVITDLVDSLVNHGLRKIVLLNSHGGNDFKPILRELYGRTPAQIFLCNWYQTIADAAKAICEQPEDHAGEWETSIMLAYRPDLVGRGEDGSLLADAGEKRKMRFTALNEGWVSITRPWHLLTTNTGSGNPHAATAEKGGQLVECFVERLAPFLVELSNATIDEGFPFEG